VRIPSGGDEGIDEGVLREEGLAAGRICFSVTIHDELVKRGRAPFVDDGDAVVFLAARCWVTNHRGESSLSAASPLAHGEVRMTPESKGSRFTSKEHREAEHIKESEEERGMSEERAKEVGWATVNKQKSKKRSA
jgi:hypothetical protein